MSVSPGTTPIGFVGLGVMGKAMSRNIMKAGYGLTVFNRSPGKVAELVGEGAVDGGSPAGVAAAADVIFVCVPDTPDVEAVLFGPDGIAEGAKAGSVVIDCSTISATATVDFAKRLKDQDVDFIDSPVSGGPQGAVSGALSCMMGGDADVVARVRPVMEAVGKTFVHVGPPGAGQVTKSCNQMLICATMMGMSEAVALCRKMDIDAGKMREALLGGAAQSFVMQNHCKRLIEETLDPGFRAALMLKDIKLAQAVGRDQGLFSPTTDLATQMLSALCETGRDGMDSAAVGLVFQEMSGLRK
jgi:3-hydroxyisobutyrate dehydrogenase-like beta-hydroxyacid dehydrogenase